MIQNETAPCHSHVTVITHTLVNRFGQPKLGNKKNPFNELLFIILSSKTPPKRYQNVYQTLRVHYPKANALASANWQDIALIIGHGGLQNRKAQAIVAISQRLRKEFGRVTLAPLKSLSIEEAELFLTSLPEVSLKTARCVLLYALNRQVFPVDSHCYRIGHRLGWIDDGVRFSQKLANKLQEGVPKSLRRDLHVGLVVLGRNFCIVTNPLCSSCPILEYCPTGQSR